MKFIFRIFILINLLLIEPTVAQTVVINEFVLRPATADGPSGGLNTGEWIELYNTTNAPIDIGCYTILCKLFAISFPAGTTIAPFDYFTIGANPSLIPLDFNWSTSSSVFSPTNQVGILSNTSDFITLWDNTQALIDGVVYPATNLPNFPPPLLPLNHTFDVGCGQINISGGALSLGSFASNNILPTTTATAHSWARKCDGSIDWVDRIPADVSPHATNGMPPIVNFVASDSLLCAGDCISFTDLSTPATGITSWNWTFSGANTATSSQQNPSGICYSTAFDWDVTLEVTNACGIYTLTKPAYISVPNVQTPIISQNNVSATCTSLLVNLSTFDIYSSYQWFMNGAPIVASNNDSIDITTTGIYQVSVVDQGCTLTSQQVSINEMGIPNFVLSLSGPTSFCSGDSLVMSFAGNYSFQWLLNNTPIAGATSNSFTAFNSGNYSLMATNGLCMDTSAVVNVTVFPPINSTVTPIFSTICNGQTQQFSATPSSGSFTYQWLFNGVVVPGVNSNVLTASVSGSYSVIVSDAIGCSSASNATLIVSSFVVPVISSSVPSLSLCTNPSITLSVPNLYSSYQWIEGSTNIAGANNSTLNVTAPGSYTIQVSDANGCTGVSTAAFVTNGIASLLNVSVNGPTQLCPGESVTMSASNIPNVTYQWLESNNPIAGATGNSLIESVAGNYSVLVTDINGCTLISNIITVTNVPQPNVNITLSGADSICVGSNVVITANPFNGSAYQWLNSNTPVNTSNSFSLVVSDAGDYSVIMTDANGCKDTSNSIVIATYEAFDISFISSTGLFNLCPGGSLSLSVNPTTAITYSWTYNGSSVGGNNFNINVSQTGQYIVVVKDANGCTDKDSVQIGSSTSPIPIILPTNEVKICSGEPVTLSTATYVSYQWLQNGVPMVDSTFQFTVVSQPGTYAVAVVDANGCVGTSAPKIITQANAPQPVIVANGAEVCEGSPRSIEVTGSFVINEWFNDDTGIETEVSSSGAYWVNVTDSNGCKGSDTAFVFFKPMPTVLLAPKMELPCGKEDSLKLITNGSVRWYPSEGLSDSTSMNPAITTKKENVFTAIVELNGCIDSATVDVTLAKCDSMYVPEAFTPNGDGLNDEFKVIGLSIKTFRLDIFNRWGQLIFSTTNIDEGWNGTYKGLKCEAGIYAWQVEAFDYFDLRVLTKANFGKVALIR
jgi:gliding motility-associated-like protein